MWLQCQHISPYATLCYHLAPPRASIASISSYHSKEIVIQREWISRKFHVINFMMECWRSNVAYHRIIEWIWSHFDLVESSSMLWRCDIFTHNHFTNCTYISGYFKLECYTNISICVRHRKVSALPCRFRVQMRLNIEKGQVLNWNIHWVNLEKLCSWLHIFP